MVRQIPRLLSKAAQRSGRQVLVSTRSEEMLHDRGISADEIAILEPTAEEMKVVVGSNHPAILAAARADLGLARAVCSITRPARA